MYAMRPVTSQVLVWHPADMLPHVCLCRHVINNADDVTVTLLDQSVYNAKVRCECAKSDHMRNNGSVLCITTVSTQHQGSLGQVVQSQQ
jgi:hypothetical protein